MLGDGARGDVVQPLPVQTITVHHRPQSRRQHFLIAHLGIGAMAACERDANAADDRDASTACSNQHGTAPYFANYGLAPAYNRSMVRFSIRVLLGLTATALVACGAKPPPSPPPRTATAT